MSHCSFCDMVESDATYSEQNRIIKLLTDLNVIRRDALGFLVAFNTEGTKVIYLEGLENK